MKILSLIMLLTFISCKSSSNKSIPVNPIKTFNDLEVEEEVKITKEQFKEEITKNFPIFHTLPLKGDSQFSKGEITSSNQYSLKTGGFTIKDTCNVEVKANTESVVEELNATTFQVRDTFTNESGVLTSGNPTNCAAFVPKAGEIEVKSIPYGNYTDGFEHLLRLAFESSETKLDLTEHGFSKSLKDKDAALAFTDFYRGGRKGQVIYRVIYRIVNKLDTAEVKGDLSSQCQVVIAPDRPAHHSVIIRNRLTTTDFKFSFNDGTKMELKQDIKVYFTPQ